MKTSEFLETFKGQNNRYRHRMLNTFCLTLRGKPFQKGGKKQNLRNELAIKEILSQIPSVRHSFREEVACNLMFFSNDKSLPQIYKLAKNCIDLINKTWIKGNFNFLGKQLKNIPLNDDRQISYLSLTQLAAGQDTMMCIKNFNHFLLDICFAYNIKNGQFGNKYMYDNRENECDIASTVGLDTVYRLIAYKYDYFLNKFNYLGKRDERYLKGIYGFNPSQVLQSLSKITENYLQRSCLAIKLQPIPSSNDELKKAVETQLNVIRRKYQKDVISEESPMHVQIIYKPFDTIKDLDNLAYSILPILQRVLKPNYSAKVCAMGNEIVELNEQSVPICELMKLGSASNQSESFILINFSDLGIFRRNKSLWDEVYNIIDQAD